LFFEVWSVLFHSWLGFVMLLMANVMWLIPRQSALMKLMVRFVSVYTACRVTITYLISFTLLYPDSIYGYNLHQFGLRYDFGLKQVPLLLQVSFPSIIYWNIITWENILIYIYLFMFLVKTIKKMKKI